MVEGMKFIEHAITPDGTEINLEDWSHNNTGLTIAAYPVAKNSGAYDWVRKGEQFCLMISQNKYQNYSNDDVRADFEALKNGTKSLEDLAAHFWNGEKDMWYLGMNVEYKGW